MKSSRRMVTLVASFVALFLLVYFLTKWVAPESSGDLLLSLKLFVLQRWCFNKTLRNAKVSIVAVGARYFVLSDIDINKDCRFDVYHHLVRAICIGPSVDRYVDQTVSSIGVVFDSLPS
ncbi:hypothetical protein GW17_00009732, partial [Ensete ventricosum]